MSTPTRLRGQDFIDGVAGEHERAQAADPRMVSMTPPAVEAGGSPSHLIEPPLVPDGTFVRVRPGDHPLPAACEVTVNFQDYHRSSSKLGRFGKIVGIDIEDGEYLVMLDNFECLAVPMRRVEWRKVAT